MSHEYHTHSYLKFTFQFNGYFLQNLFLTIIVLYFRATFIIALHILVTFIISLLFLFMVMLASHLLSC